MKGTKLLKVLLRSLITIIGLIIGSFIYISLKDVIFNFITRTDVFVVGFGIIFSLIFGIIFYLLSDNIISLGDKVTSIISTEVIKIPLVDFLTGLVGIVIGVLLAYFLSSPIKDIPYAGIPLSILLYIFLAYLGFSIGVAKKEDLRTYFAAIFNKKDEKMDKIENLFNKKVSYEISKNPTPKILDTSVIIDGRILEIIETGFIEGTIVVPTFVLKELRHIADSENDLKRVKGRRGLDILNEIQNKHRINVDITDKDYPEVEEVDIKLLELAKEISGSVVTNDYNLNKVAQFQKVKVLNINDLANAVKTKLIAGENLRVNILKEGKERSQGIGYLDDGTMIVVEDGKKLIGEEVDCTVTSVLQTSAGRMIFAKVD